jgi:hypothetical protein
MLGNMEGRRRKIQFVSERVAVSACVPWRIRCYLQKRDFYIVEPGSTSARCFLKGHCDYRTLPQHVYLFHHAIIIGCHIIPQSRGWLKVEPPPRWIPDGWSIRCPVLPPEEENVRALCFCCEPSIYGPNLGLPTAKPFAPKGWVLENAESSCVHLAVTV